jgi:hypothetical protein
VKDDQLIISGGSEADYGMILDIILDLQEEGIMEEVTARIIELEELH